VNFSGVVTKVLQEKGMKPSALARMTGYTPQYMYDLLSGHRRWNETTITKVCDALGLKIKIEFDNPA
jgi:predicted transcriptional regulator